MPTRREYEMKRKSEKFLISNFICLIALMAVGCGRSMHSGVKLTANSASVVKTGSGAGTSSAASKTAVDRTGLNGKTEGESVKTTGTVTVSGDTEPKETKVPDPAGGETGDAANNTAETPVVTPILAPREYYSSKVGIWYTVWWNSPGQQFYEHHWINMTRSMPVEDGYYGSGDPAKIKKDMTYFKKIGIDYIIYDDTNNHYNNRGDIAKNIQAISDGIQSLGTSAPQFSFAAGAPLHKGKSEEGMQKEADIFYGYYTKYPQNYFVWKDKPLLVIFTSPTYYYWKDGGDRFTQRLASGHTSEGGKVANQYSLAQNGMYGWFFDYQFKDSEIYGLSPGWSRSHNGMVEFRQPVSRENGARYTREWLNAVKANKEMIVISSWNDHAEECGIEAVRLTPKDGEKEVVNGVIQGREIEQENPFYYQQITEGYLALKTGYLENFYYRSESSDIVYQYKKGKLMQVAAPPKSSAVIVMPDDYIKWSGVAILQN